MVFNQISTDILIKLHISVILALWSVEKLKTNPLLLLLTDYSRIQMEFSLCKPPSSVRDVRQLNGLLRNAFTLMAMLDYPYSTQFMGNMPANPVKVQTSEGKTYTKAVALSLSEQRHITYNETVSSQAE